jgi:hypothetical protein
MHHVNFPALPANEKLELLRHLAMEQVAGNSWGVLFYLSFFMLPLLI